MIRCCNLYILAVCLSKQAAFFVLTARLFGGLFYAAKNYGPIPEGTWNIRQKNLQNFDDLSLPDQAISYVGGITKYVKIPLGKWPGGTFSWGNYRIPLEAREQTNTMGRTNLFFTRR